MPSSLASSVQKQLQNCPYQLSVVPSTVVVTRLYERIIASIHASFSKKV